MSKGIGALLDKQVKLKIYQQRANKYNKEFDELEEQGHDPDKIPELMTEKEFHTRHANDVQEPLPFERIDRVLPITGTTHLGFDKAHTILSSTKQMMQPAETKMQAVKQAKSQGLKITDGNLYFNNLFRCPQTLKRNMKKI
ncbi:hypothetical protein pb186bvf_008432 [Paramecium bursaria]